LKFLCRFHGSLQCGRLSLRLTSHSSNLYYVYTAVAGHSPYILKGRCPFGAPMCALTQPNSARMRWQPELSKRCSRVRSGGNTAAPSCVWPRRQHHQSLSAVERVVGEEADEKVYRALVKRWVYHMLARRV
jgi:hypothetical protein